MRTPPPGGQLDVAQRCRLELGRVGRVADHKTRQHVRGVDGCVAALGADQAHVHAGCREPAFDALAMSGRSDQDAALTSQQPGRQEV